MTRLLTLPQAFLLSGVFEFFANLAQLPLTARKDLESCARVGSLCINYKLYAGMSSALSGLSSAFSTLPLVVLATNRAPPGKNRGLFYGLYLAALDLGDSIGDWATTPIVERLGITTLPPHFGHGLTSGLSLLIIICSCMRLFTLCAFMPLLLFSRPLGKNGGSEEEDDTDEGERVLQREALLADDEKFDVPPASL
eukprot:CAMPEP_0170170660 /NCGR_PEP_ID=MMETSP0040_2-20121228/3653_1 /TAXON_ID=641309 /ORGANISM="Lotharella oceanica, Strain CCMP622" /LENGTH=195 /DNA_ID=CAMNT_0010410185 /DNA_START=56 /DNA_END=643 /DNA_ORIENTATION=-